MIWAFIKQAMRGDRMSWYKEFPFPKNYRTDCLDGSDEHNRLCGCEFGTDWPCVDGD